MSNSTSQQVGDAATVTLNTSARKVVDDLVDPETDTQPEARLKEAVIRVLNKDSKQRSKDNLALLGGFLGRYAFFEKFSKSQSDDAYASLMKAVKVKRADARQLIIQQGDDGDRFYVLLKGEAAVLKAHFRPVPATTESDPRFKIYRFIVSLFEHYDTVFWEKVPYRKEMERFLRRVRKCAAKNNVTDADQIEIIAGAGLGEAAEEAKKSPARRDTQPKEAGRKAPGQTGQGKAGSPGNFQVGLRLAGQSFQLPDRLLGRLCRLHGVYEFS